MTKVHPKSAAIAPVPVPLPLPAVAAHHSSSGSREKGTLLNLKPPSAAASEESTIVLTVWKKSLLPNCRGFTVFDGRGSIIFRVDNYVADNRGEMVLMDASGKPLITIRRKKLSLGDNFLVFDGETSGNPRYAVRKHVMTLLNSGILAHVTSCCSRDNNGSSGERGRGGGRGRCRASPNMKSVVAYEIEGSYVQRSCAVYDGKRRRVAEIKRKEAAAGVPLGADVFRLIVHQPNLIDTALAMALVIMLDQMFSSSSSSLSFNTPRRFPPKHFY